MSRNAVGEGWSLLGFGFLKKENSFDELAALSAGLVAADACVVGGGAFGAKTTTPGPSVSRGIAKRGCRDELVSWKHEGSGGDFAGRGHRWKHPPGQHITKGSHTAGFVDALLKWCHFDHPRQLTNCVLKLEVGFRARPRIAPVGLRAGNHVGCQ